MKFMSINNNNHKILHTGYYYTHIPAAIIGRMIERLQWLQQSVQIQLCVASIALQPQQNVKDSSDFNSLSRYSCVLPPSPYNHSRMWKTQVTSTVCPDTAVCCLHRPTTTAQCERLQWLQQSVQIQLCVASIALQPQHNGSLFWLCLSLSETLSWTWTQSPDLDQSST